MGQVRIHSAETIELKKIGERAGDPPPKIFSLLAKSELESSMAFHEFGGEKELQLAEIDYVPGAEAVPHKHDDDEIIYVLSGEMHFGDKILGPGSSVYIPGGTYYGFFAGPNGLRIVNFRARADISFYLKTPS